MMAKLGRHVLEAHKQETEVAKILATTRKGSPARADALAIIRKRGSFRHNQQVIEAAEGTFIVERRSSSKLYSPSEYRPCPHCKGFYHRKSLYAHMKKCCPSIPSSQSKILMAAMAPLCDDSLFHTRVISSMCTDEVTDTVKRDQTILRFGRQLFQHYDNLDSKIGFVSTKMREIGRVVIAAMRRKPDLKTVAELITPGNFDLLTESVKDVCRLKPGAKEASLPSLALKLGPSMKRLASILKNQAIREENAEDEMSRTRYFQLHESEWKEHITRYSIDARERKKKRPILPLTTDLQVGVAHCSSLTLKALPYGCVNVLVIHVYSRYWK